MKFRSSVGAAALAASSLLLVACFPDPGGETPGTTTTTTEATTTSTTEAPVVWTPELSVSKTSGLNPDGDTITIEGSGFNPAANIGTRAPLNGLQSGVYVAFGKYADVWQPSAGAPAGARQNLRQIWAVPQASYDVLVAAPYNQDPANLALIQPDGSFSIDFQVATSETGTNAYGFVTYPGSGASNAAQEFKIGATFAPKVTASKTTDLVAGETVTVKGIGFLPSALGTRAPLPGQAGGVYVAFGKYAAVWQPSAGAPGSARQNLSQIWAVPQASHNVLTGAPYNQDPAGLAVIQPDGSFTLNLTITTSATGTNPYGFVTYPGSGASNAAQELHLEASFAPVEETVAQ